MLHSAVRRHNKRWMWGIAIVLLLAALGFAVYLIRLGNTDSWPEADCTVTGSRVVRADLEDQYRFTLMYTGEYQLRYVVSGHEYYVWAKAGWLDTDKQFVQAKVDSLPGRCDFHVRFNPDRPSEAIAVRK
jgi:hypothetical protein